MKFKILLIALCFYYQSGWSQITPTEMIADLVQLQQLIEDNHISPFWLTSKETFEATVQNAKNIIAQKDSCDQSCYVELFKIIASIKDGHSSISGGSRYEIFGYFPFSAKWFGDQLVVVKAPEKYASILGCKIEKVDGKNINDILDILRAVVPHANESRFKKYAGSYLHLPGLLYGLGITNDPKSARFTFSKDDEIMDLQIIDMLPPEEEEKAVFVAYLDGKKTRPLYQRNNDQYYWFDYDAESKVFYFQYNRIGNMKTESSSAFAKKMWSFVDSVEINKFVLDFRYNGGGNFPYCLRFLQGILDRRAINKRGNLFVITGYETFSATISMLNQLEAKSEAIIIGEVPCDHPARPGDPEGVELKNTQLKVNLSTLFHPTIFPDDQRDVIILDAIIPLDWAEYRAGRDPVMHYINAYIPTPKVKAIAKGYKPWVGRYAYSPSRHILIKDKQGELWMEISHGLETPLYESDSRKIAEQGYTCHLIKMSLRLPVRDYKKITHLFDLTSSKYVIGGHSQGGKMAAQFVYENPTLMNGLFLMGTSHPRDIDLSNLSIPTIKLYAEYDGLASVGEVLENKAKLPKNTQLIFIKGGNHSQFGYLGKLLGDQKADISVEQQQTIAVESLIALLNTIEND